MALTATAKVKTRMAVMKSLDMANAYVLSQDPNKLNIFYDVKEKKDIDDVVQTVVQEIVGKGTSADRTIIFCRTYKDNALIYENIVFALASAGVLLKDKEMGVCICEKFTACSSERTKTKVLASFTELDGFVRIVVATIAFGMGLDTPNVRTIIHWGPPESVEAYVQETGRSGRDGKQSYCILYYSAHDIAANSRVDESIRAYCRNNVECRRKLLISQFSADSIVTAPTLNHLCCSVCEQQCSCTKCSTDCKEGMDTSCINPEEESPLLHPAPNQIVVDMLQQQLEECHDDLYARSSEEVALVGADICTGLSKSTFLSIAKNYMSIKQEADLMNYGVSRMDVHICVHNILKKFTE